MSRLRPGFRRERGGSPAIELVGMLPMLLLAGLAAWQLLLVGWVATTAEQAARTGSRVAALHASASAGQQAALDALPAGLRPGARALPRGPTRLEVRVEIPVLHPRLRSPDFAVRRVAEMPPRAR